MSLFPEPSAGIVRWQGEDVVMIGLMRVRVIGPSMEPTLRNGQVCWARRGGLRPGRIGVFAEPARPGLVSIKRLVRREGEGWWVEGDNPEQSTDSRGYGSVPTSAFLGTIIWPRIGHLSGPRSGSRA